MYRPEYDFGKRRRYSSLGPPIFLGLLVGVIFGLLTGILPIGLFGNWWGGPLVSAHPPSEIAVSSEVETQAATTPATPFPVSSELARSDLILAPAFELPDLFSDSLNRSLEDYKGQPVILNFWASWCVPCKEEMPALQQVYEKHREEGLVVLGVNQTFVDGLDAARDFVTELSLTFPNVRDDTGNTSEDLYQVIGLPTSVFITPAGEVANKRIGQMTDEQIEIYSQQLISGETIGP